MSPRVTVTLAALNGNLDPAVRVFDLDFDRVSVPIGRASKTLSKGLQGARDNAWFDSPVMSRDHAELMLDLETDSLAIQDIGSMHGTFLNGSRITTNLLTELNDGDELVFGAEVRRGTEIFPACAFRVTYELGPYKATNTYAFPDTSDNEEVDEEADFSEEDSENEEVSSEDEESVIAMGHKISQSSQAIDLTRDDSPMYSPYRSIDLTGDVATASTRPEISLDVDSDEELEAAYEEEEGFTQGDEQLEINEQSNYYSSEDEVEGEVEGAVICEGVAVLPAGTYIDALNDEEMDSSVYDYDSDGSSQEEPQIFTADHVSSPTVTVIKGADRMVATDDEHNDFGLPKAAADAMRVMADNGLLQGNASHYPYPYSSFWSGPGELSHSTVIPDTFASTSQPPSASGAGRPAFSNRQPSPSDAAMAKGTDKKDAEIPLSYVRSTANLGAGSGKEEFFKARELNKAALFSQESWSSRGRMTATHETLPEASTVPTPPVRVIKACATKRMRSMASEAMSDAEGKPKEASPVAKALVADSLTESTFEPLVQPVRSGLRIDEIIDKTANDQEPIIQKRKADEISNVVEEDIRVWASASNSVDTSESQAPTPTEIAIALTSVLSQTSEQRPAKKLRKLMENVAYAALGGVAVGAALFGSLVATAPDFM